MHEVKQLKRDKMYMDIAEIVANQSYAIRNKVGALIAKDDNIISYGWNGMPEGMDNVCEYTENGILITKQECRHAELNAILKLAKTNGGALGSTMYVTLSPCIPCANLIKAAGITRVVYKNEYRIPEGVSYLRNMLGVSISKLIDTNISL